MEEPRDPDPARPAHPIAVVAERTGLSRDVLRVWERRYGAVEPARTAGGQRLYSDEQVRRFRLLASVTNAGRSIGSVAGLPTEELERLAAEDQAERVPADSVRRGGSAHEARVEAALAQVRALDGSGLNRGLRHTVARDGVARFLEEIVPALMHRIGDEWEAGRLAISHEHLASAVVLEIILEAIRAVPESPDAPRLLVTTPSGERHAVGAALVAAAAALEGWTVDYLGVDVPAADIAAAALASAASAVAVSIVYTDNPAFVVRELRAVRAALPARVPLLAGGAAAVRMTDSLAMDGLVVCSSVADMRPALQRAAAPS
jgi:DNA-binding transcriptional MerR regulator/methylmalonyl-CoA mutase cobalamin-binding subunit